MLRERPCIGNRNRVASLRREMERCWSRCLDERFTKADQVSGIGELLGSGEDIFEGLLGLLLRRDMFSTKGSFQVC